MAPTGPKSPPVSHDEKLFEALLAEARRSDPGVRAGSMFGSPSIFLGRRMIGCVFGRSIGLKVPEALARQAIADGSAEHFRPYGKPVMREWIEIAGRDLGRHASLVEQAVRFAAAG